MTSSNVIGQFSEPFLYSCRPSVVLFSWVKVMVSEVSDLETSAAPGNGSPSCVRIQESNTNRVDRMQSD